MKNEEANKLLFRALKTAVLHKYVMAGRIAELKTA